MYKLHRTGRDEQSVLLEWQKNKTFHPQPLKALGHLSIINSLKISENQQFVSLEL